MYIFNPEHDLCLANGDRNFCPPASAMKFGQDCHDILRWMGDSSGTGKVSAWGWDHVLKRRLVRSGLEEDMLPSDVEIDAVRELSHRRIAADAAGFISARMPGNSPLVRSVPEELTDESQLCSFLERNGRAVLKAPWSGSGKGLRWVSRGSVQPGDIGWCRRVISSQGSVLAECRKDVVTDFAMLFRIEDGHVSSEGLSLFYTENGAYRGNLLASDACILRILSCYVPEKVVLMVRDAMTEFLVETFAGRYEGYLGADMFICREGDRYLVDPCVEINVRMTMGLLARRYYDRHFSLLHPGNDGTCLLEVIYDTDPSCLSARLESAIEVLNETDSGTMYAVCIKEKESGL